MTSTIALGLSASSRDEELDRRHARARIYDLFRAMQTGGSLSREIVNEVIAEAEDRGWSDVAKLGLYLGIVCERYIERTDTAASVAALLARAETDGDRVMAALALAIRAQDLAISGSRAPVDADRDLARATVLLEGFEGRRTEAVSAHIECARAYDSRDLYELQFRHYEAAERCLDPDEVTENRRATLLYNSAEVQVNWVAALRELGTSSELTERAERARRALDDADVSILPDAWREELRILRELIDAIAPPSGAPRTRAAHAEGDQIAYAYLVRALQTSDVSEARDHCDRAIETLDRLDKPRIYLFALALAVELEATEAGHETAGLRWGRELVRSRWERRGAYLASMESLIGVERLAAEHAELRQHAYLDDLTGLANRRALARFTDGLLGRGVHQAAVAIVDLDRFKQINDTFGHGVGDATLSRLATILRSGVREQDLVVRLGGDEFLLLLTMHDQEAARRRCEAIIETVLGTRWGEVSDGLDVTASLGLAFGSLEDLDGLRALADAALYRAKQAGGGCLAV